LKNGKQTMKKKFHSHTMSTAALASLVLSSPLYAADIEEVIITASPHGKTEAEVIGSINILDGDALQREAAATLGETLQNQIGVNSSSFGAGVGSPVIRGQSGKRVEILQNNSIIADVSDTSADHAIATESMLADRIEILRGPATLRYGSGATGGVVNVINNRIHSEQFSGVAGGIEARHNDNNDESALVGRIDAGTGNLILHLDAVTRESNNVEIPGYANLEADDPDETTDGYIANSDREADSQNLGLSWVSENFIGGFSIGNLDNNYGVPPGAHTHHEEDHDHEEEDHEEEEEEFVRIDLEQTNYQAKLKWLNLGEQWDFVSLDISSTDYQHQELETVGTTTEIGTLFETDSLDARLEITHGAQASSTNAWQGAIGLQYGDREFNAIGEEAFVAPSTTDTLGLFVLEETSLDFGHEPSTLELGMRVDQQSVETAGIESIEHNSINASASLLVPVSVASNFSFILSSTERAPVAEELLSDGEHVATGTYEIGDADLDTEQAINVELSWAYQSPNENGLDFRASVYHNNYSNYIYQRDTELLFNHDLEESGAAGLAACSTEAGFDDSEEAEEAVECFTWEQDGAKFTGIEAELNWSPTNQHSLRFWGDLVRAKLDNGNDLPLIPAARIGTSWGFSTGNWDTELSIVHAFEQDHPGENQEVTDAYTRVNAVVGYGVEQWSVFLRGTNLTDEDIRNSASITREQAPEPGRALTLGARYSF
jgi:iron complex outermembrane receptor protein